MYFAKFKEKSILFIIKQKINWVLNFSVRKFISPFIEALEYQEVFLTNGNLSIQRECQFLV